MLLSYSWSKEPLIRLHLSKSWFDLNPDIADNVLKSVHFALFGVLPLFCSENLHQLCIFNKILYFVGLGGISAPETPFQEILKTFFKVDENDLKNKNLRILFLTISRNANNIFESPFLRSVGILSLKKIQAKK